MDCDKVGRFLGHNVLIDWFVYYVWQQMLDIQGGPKNGTICLYFITLPNINRFSKFFHCQNQETIVNKTLTIDPTTPYKCVTTLPCKMSLENNN